MIHVSENATGKQTELPDDLLHEFLLFGIMKAEESHINLPQPSSCCNMCIGKRLSMDDIHFYGGVFRGREFTDGHI